MRPTAVSFIAAFTSARSRRAHHATRLLACAGLLAGLAVVFGCGGDKAPATQGTTGADAGADRDTNTGVDGATGTDGGVDATELPISVSAADFDCLLDWKQVNRYRIKSLTGQLDDALAVANNPKGGVFPAGTIIQLIPTEAMVKHRAGWSPKTKDWEFFFLKVDAKKTRIAARGTTDVVNGFGGNCFDCHAKAAPQWDMLCEQDHGCAKLPFSAEFIANVQKADSRCGK